MCVAGWLDVDGTRRWCTARDGLLSVHAAPPLAEVALTAGIGCADAADAADGSGWAVAGMYLRATAGGADARAWSAALRQQQRLPQQQEEAAASAAAAAREDELHRKELELLWREHRANVGEDLGGFAYAERGGEAAAAAGAASSGTASSSTWEASSETASFATVSRGPSLEVPSASASAAVASSESATEASEASSDAESSEGAARSDDDDDVALSASATAEEEDEEEDATALRATVTTVGDEAVDAAWHGTVASCVEEIRSASPSPSPARERAAESHEREEGATAPAVVIEVPGKTVELVPSGGELVLVVNGAFCGALTWLGYDPARRWLTTGTAASRSGMALPAGPQGAKLLRLLAAAAEAAGVRHTLPTSTATALKKGTRVRTLRMLRYPSGRSFPAGTEGMVLGRTRTKGALKVKTDNGVTFTTAAKTLESCGGSGGGVVLPAASQEVRVFVF